MVFSKHAKIIGGLAVLEDLVRERLDIFYKTALAKPESELYRLCDKYIDKGLDDILKALPEIDRAYDESSINDDDQLIEANHNEILQAIQGITAAADKYNRLITHTFYGRAVAKVFKLQLYEQELDI